MRGHNSRYLALIPFCLVAVFLFGNANASTTSSQSIYAHLSVEGPSLITNLGGLLRLHVSAEGQTCTLKSAHWIAGSIMRTVACSPSSTVSVVVPPNPSRRPFRAELEIDAVGVGRSVIGRASFTVSGALPLPLATRTNGLTFQAPPGAGLSTNWSGYVIIGAVGTSFPIGTVFRGVEAKWTIPRISCGITPDSAVSIWVGVDGWNQGVGGPLFQTGTEFQCTGQRLSQWGWWTDQSDGYEPQDVMTISAGDVVEAEVLRVDTADWEYVLIDRTSGVMREQIEPYGGPARSAEWIVEDPGIGFQTLSDFSPVTFSVLGLAADAGFWSDPPTSDEIIATAGTGSSQAVPTAVNGSGSTANFKVSYG